ncbi:hypothetical protein Btru_030074 [Bulinus truncatus]|nr:hypothetical protein Btru_030074 [Bulinus truncatus]
MEDTTGLETYRSDEGEDNLDSFREEKSKTFLIQPSSGTSAPSSRKPRGPRQPTEMQIQGPGYKFEVNKYNMVKRASILNKAERLLDARRNQFSDGSESSDEGDDDDSVSHVSQPGHRTLKYVKQFDDTTSYNSSDDVLNSMRYQSRGPISQTARRARLSSVNARLNKQKRLRAARRQVRK